MVTLKTSNGKVEFDFDTEPAPGDFADIYYGVLQQEKATGDGGDIFDRLMDEVDLTTPVVVKVLREVSQEAFFRAEQDALQTMGMAESELTTSFQKYFPRILAETHCVGRPTRILERATGFATLAHVLEKYPDGIPYEDFAWIFKRILAGIGYAHSKQIVHGALTPAHIMIHGAERGAKLLDWCYSVPIGKQSIRAYVSEYKRFYPESVFQKRLATPSLDLHMVGKIAIALLGGDMETNTVSEDRIPPALLKVVHRCFVPGTGAWDIHEQFDSVLETVVGKPRYRVFDCRL